MPTKMMERTGMICTKSFLSALYNNTVGVYAMDEEGKGKEGLILWRFRKSVCVLGPWRREEGVDLLLAVQGTPLNHHVLDLHKETLKELYQQQSKGKNGWPSAFLLFGRKLVEVEGNYVSQKEFEEEDEVGNRMSFRSSRGRFSSSSPSPPPPPPPPSRRVVQLHNSPPGSEQIGKYAPASMLPDVRERHHKRRPLSPSLPGVMILPLTGLLWWWWCRWLFCRAPDADVRSQGHEMTMRRTFHPPMAAGWLMCTHLPTSS